MAGFQFRFESLLRHRRDVEDQRQRELARLVRTRMIFHEELRKMQETIRDSKQEMAGSLVGKVDLGQISAFAGYSQQVQTRGREIVVRLAQLESEVDVSRQRLLDAARQRKALDRLREQHHTAWRREQDRREANELDELSTQRYARGMTTVEAML